MIMAGTDKKYVETPLMKQYYQIKSVHPDAILLFRVGDFYETFGDDAIKASGILGITLTRRANGSATFVELAGFPLPRHRHLPAQAGAGRGARGDLRTAGRPQAGERTRQEGRHRAGYAGRRSGRQPSGQQGKRLPGFGLLRPADHGRGLSRHFDRRILRGRGTGQLHRQTPVESRPKRSSTSGDSTSGSGRLSARTTTPTSSTIGSFRRS